MLTTVDLRCEYARTPLGIDACPPRLSWQLRATIRGQRQSAYQLRAATSPDLLARDAPDLLDTGKVASSAQMVAYAGPELQSRERVWWQVRAWDHADEPGPYSEITWFETGLLNPEDWHAEWIGFSAGWNGRALYFRTPLHLDKPVRTARAYVSGLGYYELRLNGRKVGDHVLDPGTTSYDKRVLYVTYDIAPYLRAGAGLGGENVLAAIVGHGWYGAPKLLLQVEITFEDGSIFEVLGQTGPWQVGLGPIVGNSIYGGELYDARLEIPGWDMPATADGDRPVSGQNAASEGSEADTAQWVRPNVVDGPGGTLVAQALEPIRVVQTLAPVTVSTPRPDVFVCDLGQNIAGWARLRCQGSRGSRVTLRFAESLYPDGTVNQENLRSAAATDVYILKGDGVEIWEPRFTYHGFRYVQVEGYPGALTQEAVEGRLVRSDTHPAAEFTCSNELLNRIHRMVWWTEATNQHSIPTDCPQRDERMGWLNDLGARTEEAIINFDLSRFFPKWVADIHDAQDPHTGAITDTAPYRWGTRPADPVSVSYLLIAWMVYVHYGDTRSMYEHYEGFKAWVEYLASRAQDHIVTYSYYGDWAPPVEESVGGSQGTSAVSLNTPGALVSTGYYYYAARLLSQMAEVLDKRADALHYAERARKIAAAYHEHFYDPATGGYGSNNQACNALSAYLGLVPEHLQDRVIENLVHDVLVLHDGHLTTGNLCTKYLLEVLTHNHHADVAYRVVTQETYPSWGYMLANGATTVWERWEHATGGGMNSHNHPMYASVGAWLCRALGGIMADPKGPGFARFDIRPHPAGDLTHARCSLETVRGRIESAWMLEGERLTLQVTVPVGSNARICVPVPSKGDRFRITEAQVPVWQDGPMDSVPGLESVHAEPHCIAFAVGSGSYTFVRELYHDNHI